MIPFYDWFVLGFSNRLVWRCPTHRQLAFYNEHISDNHLDIGPGSGYYLDRCHFPVAQPRITLMDNNQANLARAAGRIARYHPTLHQASLLNSSEFPSGPFGYIGVGYVLHFLPGSIEGKVDAFAQLLPLLAPGGVLFVTTILGADVPANALAQRVLRVYQRKGIFRNQEDTPGRLHTALQSLRAQTSLAVVGCVALITIRP